MADHTHEIEISCLDVIREISNYVDLAVDPGLRSRMEAHMAKCAHCTAILDGTQNVIRLAGDGRVFEVPAGFSERLKSRLMAATRE